MLKASTSTSIIYNETTKEQRAYEVFAVVNFITVYYLLIFFQIHTFRYNIALPSSFGGKGRDEGRGGFCSTCLSDSSFPPLVFLAVVKEVGAMILENEDGSV